MALSQKDFTVHQLCWQVNRDMDLKPPDSRHLPWCQTHRKHLPCWCVYCIISSPPHYVSCVSFQQVLPKSHPCLRQTRLFRLPTQFWEIQFLLAQRQQCWKTGSETRAEHEVWTRLANGVRYKTGMRRDPVNKPLGYSLMLTLANSQASTQWLSCSSFSAGSGEKKWWKC